jgi:hypothetical protein
MRASTFARKPPGKRGVNKATMNAPQEEFIAEAANVGKGKRPEVQKQGRIEESAMTLRESRS